MQLRDLHTHTVFSDGLCTPEEMVLAAIEKGLTEIGISDHSYAPFHTGWCMKEEDVEKYITELRRLRDKYKDRISVLAGIEQDYYSEGPTDIYDYVIGSVHFMKIGGSFVPVDENTEFLTEAADTCFSGDIYCVTEVYYETVADVVSKTNADIIGHFDLIAKLNEKSRLFDEKHPRYEKAWKSAADVLLKTGKVFEINTGAISRGYRSYAYPMPDALRYLEERGAKFIYTSDSHTTSTLCFGFSLN